MAIIDVIKADITSLEVEAIVNAANTSLLGGGGVDGAIHRAAGPELLEECRLLNGCKTGEAKITKGYNLKSKFVIHTVGPIWRGGVQDEEALLKACYLNSLEIAKNHYVKTIAFPSISTGIYGFPIDKAAKIAISVVKNFGLENLLPEKIIFVCFSDSDFQTYSDLLNQT